MIFVRDKVALEIRLEVETSSSDFEIYSFRKIDEMFTLSKK